MRGYSEPGIGGTLVGFVLLLMTGAVLLFLLALGVAGFFLFLYLKRRVTHFVSMEYAKPRLFDAPPSTQWVSTYEYWLYKLEDVTGLTFTRWPGQILLGCLIVSSGAALVISLLVALFIPQIGSGVFVPTLGIGSAIGGLTGLHMGQPATHWFESSEQSNFRLPGDDGDGFELGSEQGDEW